MKIKREFVFITISILLLAAVIGFVFYSIDFLFANTKKAVSQNLMDGQKNLKFNLDGLKKLGIIQ